MDKIYSRISPYQKLRDKYTLQYENIKHLKLLSCFKWLEFSICKDYDLDYGRLDCITIKTIKADNLKDYQYIIKECEKEGLLYLRLPLHQYSSEHYPKKPRREQYSKDYILDLVSLIRTEYKLEDLKLDAYELLDSLGGEVTYDKDLIDDFTAKPTKNGFKISILRSSYDEVNQSKIIHEIGHALLHKGLFTIDWELKKNKKMDDLDRRKKGTYDIEEKEIKIFMDELMMPREKFVNALYSNMKNSCIDIRKVAQLFGVSNSEAETRAYQLGIIER